MAVTFNDGFEDNDLTNAPAYTQYEEGGTIDISTDAAYQGTYGVRCECASRNGWTTFALYNLAQSPSSTDYFEFEIMWRRTAETNTTVFTGTCVGWRVESPHWGPASWIEAESGLTVFKWNILLKDNSVVTAATITSEIADHDADEWMKVIFQVDKSGANPVYRLKIDDHAAHEYVDTSTGTFHDMATGFAGHLGSNITVDAVQWDFDNWIYRDALTDFGTSGPARLWIGPSV